MRSRASARNQPSPHNLPETSSPKSSRRAMNPLDSSADSPSRPVAGSGWRTRRPKRSTSLTPPGTSPTGSDEAATDPVSCANHAASPWPYNLLYPDAPVILDGGRSIAVRVLYKDPSRHYRKDRPVSLQVSWSGAVTGEFPAPTRPQQYAGTGIAEAVYPRSVSSLRAIPFGIPFGPTFLVVRSRSGVWATAFTGAYDVSLRRPEGTRIARIMRIDVAGPPLLPEETASACATLQSWARQARAGGGRLSVTDPPEARPPIQSIWFDADDRLWVQRSSAGDDPRSRADIHSSDGTLIFRAEWPRAIDLRQGAASERSAWGTRETALDEQILTRLRFAPSPGPD